jgi:hypothetical protein
VLTALRHQRARESDLIHEAYYEAFKEELRRSPAVRWSKPDTGSSENSKHISFSLVRDLAWNEVHGYEFLYRQS